MRTLNGFLPARGRQTFASEGAGCHSNRWVHPRKSPLTEFTQPGLQPHSRYYCSFLLVSSGAYNHSTAGLQRTFQMSQATGVETARQAQELHIFHDVAKALTSSLDLDSIL